MKAKYESPQMIKHLWKDEDVLNNASVQDFNTEWLNDASDVQTFGRWEE